MALRADDVDLRRDRDLVVRSQAGDDGAFEDLYRRYFDRLYRFCLRRVGDPHEAEELAQETFARAYRALPRLGGDRRFYPWLSVIASRLCVDEFRRRARSEPTAVVDLGTGEDAHDRILRAVDADLLGRAMARLTPRHRDVLRLREHEGWSYQHIADSMGVNLGTVEALLHRARRALRREFDLLSGPETVPAVVGGGVMARLARRLHGVRNRLVTSENGWTPLLGNAMAAVAVVVTMIAAGPAAPTPSVPLRMSPAAAVSPGSPDGERGGGGVAGTPSHNAQRGNPAPEAGPGEGGGSGAGRLPLDPADVTSRLPGGVPLSEDGRGRSEDQPLVQEVEGLTVGADPEAVVTDSGETVDHWHDWATEERQ